MYVCLCKGVTDRAIHEAMAAGAETPEDIAAMTGAGSCCGGCGGAVEAMLAEREQAQAAVSTASSASTPTPTPSGRSRGSSNGIWD